VKATVEPLEGNKVKLSVEVDEPEFEEAIDAAFRKIAREVRIPGFRPGKVPRKVLEARIGTDAARHQALQDSVPEYYARAVREHDVDVIAAPEIDITGGQDGGPLAFDAVVEVRPRVIVPGYASLRVTIPSPEPTDDEIDAQVEHLRRQFAELEVVDRPAIEGDYVTIDVAGSRDGEPLPGLTADDYLYLVGSGAVVPELDRELLGRTPGDIIVFQAAHPGDEDAAPIDFRVLVKEVKAQVLPDLDDAFAAEASEFDTLAELREDLARRLAEVKRVRARMALREQVGQALAALVEDEVPEALIGAEMSERLNDLAMRLSAQGLTVEQWLETTGQDRERFVEDLREAAITAAKVDLALRAVAEAQGIEVGDDDLEAEIAALAERVGQSPAKVRAQLERAGQVPAIRSDLTKRKALEWLVDTVEIVDEDGRPVDRSSLETVDETGSGPGDTPHDTDAATDDKDAE
jgi:trigger factor